MGWTRVLLRIGVASAVVLVAVIGWFALDALRGREHRISEAEQQDLLLASSLSEHAGSVFHRVDSALQVMSTLFANYLQASDAARAAMVVSVREILEQAAVIDDFYLVDSTGQVLFEPDVPSGLRRYLQQRPEQSFGFQALGSTFTMSKVIVDPDDHAHLLLTRQLVIDSKNLSVGTIVVRIGLAQFQLPYDRLVAGSGRSISLYRSDALLLVRAPARPDLLNRVAAPDPFENLADGATRGAVSDVRWQGGPPAAVGYAAVQGFPLVVAVAIDEGIVLAGWRAGLISSMALLALAAAGLAAMLWIIYRLFHQQERIAGLRHEADQRLSDLTHAIPAIVYEAAPDGTTTFVTRHWFAMASTPAGTDIQAQWDASVHPDDFAGVKQRWRRSVERQVDHVSEYRVRTPDGSYRWQQSRAVPARDAQGRVRAWYGTLVDIEDLKQAEIRARDAEAQLRLLFEQGPYPLYVIDRESTRIVAASDEAVRISGWSRDELLAMSGNELYPAEDRAIAAARRENFSVTETRTYRGIRHRRKDGTVFDTEVAVRLIEYHGRPATLAMVMDVTERLRVTRAREAAETQLRLLFEQSPYPLYVTDRETLRILAVSDEAVRTGGWSRDELLTMSGGDIFPPEDLPMVVARRKMFTANATKSFQDVRQRRKDGTVFDIEMAVRVIEYNGRPTTLAMMIDVSDRHRAERARRAAEERNRYLFEASPYPIYVVDCETMRVLVVSDEAVRVSGWSREELLAMNANEFYLPEDLPGAIAERERFTALGTQTVVRRRNRRKDGTVFDSEIAMRVIDYDGRPAYLAIVMDVTERLQAERAREAAEQRYRQLFDANPYSIVLVDRETLRFVMVNDATSKLYGWSREEFLAMTPDDLFLPEDLPAVVAERKSAVPDVTVTIRGRRHRRKDGTIIDVDMTLRLIELNGRPTRLAIIQDVTAHKQADKARQAAEDELRRSQESYRMLFDANPYPVSLIDHASWRFLAVNDAALALYGWSREEALVMAANDVYLPEDVPKMVALREGFSSNRIQVLRGLRHRRKDGTLMDVEMSVRLIEVDERPVILAIVQDVTELKRIERARAAAEEQLRQSQKMEAVGQLTGGIAHDFNNILTVILANADALQEEEGLDVGVVERLDRISKAVGRASDLTRSLLVYSRKQPLSPRPSSVNDLVTTVGRLLGRALGEHIELDFVLAEDLWTISIDRTQFETALVNLSVNARDAMPDGGRLLVETRNEAVAEDDGAPGGTILAGDYVVVAVTDTGSGMSPEAQAKVFEPFFTTKEVGKGTGLGLSMVYGFVTQSGGGIRIDSEVGHGSSFKLFFPRSLAKEEALAIREATPMPRGSEQVLVVEDEPLVRASVVLALQSLDYTVVEAADGTAGWAAVEAAAQPFDLLLTDVVMPGPLNGRALAEKVATRHPSTRIVFMSGYSRDILTRDGRLDGGVALLGKPFRKADLARTVRAALDNPAGPVPTA